MLATRPAVLATRPGVLASPTGHLIAMQWIGTAGWSLPRKPSAEGTHLLHYARALPCAEVNSSFYRPHRPGTWAKWAAETPAGFRFSIKAPKTITHEAKLCGVGTLLEQFLAQVSPLAEKTGPILFQLPPSLVFESSTAQSFLATLRSLHAGEVALEPRHATWFTPQVDALLQEHRVARVAADPPKGAAEAAQPGGDTALVYYRLHGSPRMYYSNYEDVVLRSLAAKIEPLANVWVVFDNTAAGYAYSNALRLRELIHEG